MSEDGQQLQHSSRRKFPTDSGKYCELRAAIAGQLGATFRSQSVFDRLTHWEQIYRVPLVVELRDQFRDWLKDKYILYL